MPRKLPPPENVQCAWCGAPFPRVAELRPHPGDTEEDAWDRQYGWHYADCRRVAEVEREKQAGKKVRP